MSIGEKILAIISESHGLEKTGEMKEQGNYKFFKIDDVLGHLKPLFIKHQIVFYHSVESHECHNRDYKNKHGDAKFERATVKDVRCVLLDPESGETIEGVETAYGVDAQDKGPGKATSYAVKTWLLNVFMLKGQPDEDILNTDFDTYIDGEKAAVIERLVKETGSDMAEVLKWAKADKILQIKESRYVSTVKALEAKLDLA